MKGGMDMGYSVMVRPQISSAWAAIMRTIIEMYGFACHITLVFMTVSCKKGSDNFD